MLTLLSINHRLTVAIKDGTDEALSGAIDCL
jgi:hypothetical protein